jgi:tRNA wybutosine-synthesizing protein 2
VKQVVESLLDPLPPRCVAFCGDNRFALEVMISISAGLEDTENALNIRHANLGLLPTSQGAWRSSANILNHERGGWLHVHENAEISQVRDKEQHVLDGLRSVLNMKSRLTWEVSCENIEMVKTYAPGVGHYVFDIKLWPAR